MNLADGNTMAVQGYQLEGIVVDLHQFSGHHFVVFIVGNGKNGLAYDFL